MKKKTEHSEQAAFIDWLDIQALTNPDLLRIYAVPNGGKRNIGTARKMKAEGQRAGVPDLVFPQARGGYHGLYMETKVKPNKPTPEQVSWLDWLDKQGYAAAVCYGFEGLKETLEWYLSL